MRLCTSLQPLVIIYFIIGLIHSSTKGFPCCPFKPSPCSHIVEHHSLQTMHVTWKCVFVGCHLGELLMNFTIQGILLCTLYDHSKTTSATFLKKIDLYWIILLTLTSLSLWARSSFFSFKYRTTSCSISVLVSRSPAITANSALGVVRFKRRCNPVKKAFPVSSAVAKLVDLSIYKKRRNW